MKLTKFEKEICARHHSDEEGIIHCDDCPLVIDAFNCKATVSRKEFKRYMKEQIKESKRHIKEVYRRVKELNGTD